MRGTGRKRLNGEKGDELCDYEREKERGVERQRTERREKIKGEKGFK